MACCQSLDTASGPMGSGLYPTRLSLPLIPPTLNTSHYPLPWWLRGQRICLQWGRLGFDPRVRKIPLEEGIGQPTPVFLPGESPWTENPGRATVQVVGHNWMTFTFSFSQVWVIICASDQMTINGRIQQSLNSINLLEWLTEFRGTFYILDHQFFTKGYNSRTARWKRDTGHGKGKGHRASMLSPGTPAFPNLHVSTNLEALQILPFWGFMEVLLQTKDWLNLSTWLTKPPAPLPSLKVKGLDWTFQP